MATGEQAAPDGARLANGRKAVPAPLLRDSLRRAGRVRLAVTGASMRPFIRSGDVVELTPGGDALPAPGAVVLVEEPGGRLLLHRVTRRTAAGIHTRGDANRGEEGPFPPARILALVAGVVDAGRLVPLDRGLRGALGRSWSASGAGPGLLRLCGGIRRAGGGLMRRTGIRPDRGARR